MNKVAMEFDSEEKSFSPRSVASPVLECGEVLIRVSCCTICGSDLHTYTGRRQSPRACVLGHEIIGHVDDWGGEIVPTDYHGNELRRGQRVTWAMAVGCGQCFYCQRGLNQKCESLFKYGHHPGGPHPEGKGHPRGGLSHYCVLVPGTPVFAIPDELSDFVASPANCATATVSAALRLIQQTHSIPESNAMVVGAGMLGLTAAAQLSVLGAREILVVDPDPRRQSLALRFGATATCDPASASERMSTLTAKRGVDVALDFAGVPAAVQECLHSARAGGVVVIAGSVFATDPIEFFPEQWVRRMLTIRGLHNYAPQDLDAALQFLCRNHEQFPFGELVSQVFPLGQAKAAFDCAETTRPIRVAVRPEWDA